MDKTLLLLGGARYALPVIDAAHNLGAKVVTCDYLPNNYAHSFSDEYVNASIVDRDAVLRVADSISADGVMSFAADPGVTSAAYAAEKLGLPFQGSYEAVSILQDKGRFREFLRDNGFNCPESWTFGSKEEALAASQDICFPVIVKPTDSAGSKGCTRVDEEGGLASAVEYALSFSIDGGCIVEQFLEKMGDSSDADGFAIGGEMACVSFTSQMFDASVPNPYTPASYMMPASMPAWAQKELKDELQRVCDLLRLRSGVFNIETRVSTDGKPYIMEMTPRGGGNRLCEMLRYATGGKTDLIDAAVRAALGMEIDEVSMPVYDGFWYQEMLHSSRSGKFRGVAYAPGFRESHVAEEQLWVSPGEHIEAFSAANHAFGSVFLRFDSEQELTNFRNKKDSYLTIEVS